MKKIKAIDIMAANSFPDACKFIGNGLSLGVVERLGQFVFFVSAQWHLSPCDFNIFTIELFNFFQIHDIGLMYPKEFILW
jgi:hypothetical protein